MGASEEILKLRMQQNVEQEARKASAALARVDVEVGELNAAFSRGAVSTARYRERLAELTAEHGKLAAAAQRSARASEQVGRGGGRGGAMFGGAGGAAMQFASIADDIQYGARGIQNNISGAIAALGGYTPAAQLAAGASSILVGVFRDQIDAGLAWAGVLDSNLVKGLDKGTESIEKMASAVERLGERLKNAPAAAQDAGAKLATAFEGGGAEGRSKIAQQLISEGFGADRFQETEDRIAQGKALRDRLGPMDFLARGRIEGNISADQDRLVEMRNRRAEDAQKAVEDLIARSAQGDTDAGARLSGLARRSGQVDFAAEVDRQRGVAPPEVAVMGPDRGVMEEGFRRQDEEEQARKDREAALEEEMSLLDEEESERSAAFNAKRQENQSKADDLAGQLLQSPLGESIYAGTATEEDVAEQLRRAGIGEDIIGRRSGQILESANAQADEDIKRRALESGLTEDQARLLARSEAAGGKPPNAPAIIGAESFVSQVQAGGAKDPAELLKTMNEKQDKQIKVNEDILRELKRGGRLGA